jgi:hypothetical protein
LLVMSHKVIVILADEMAGLSPEHHELVVQRKREFFRLLRDTLDELSEGENVRPINSTVVAFSVFGALLWLPRWYNSSGSLTPEEVIGEMRRLFCHGLQRFPSRTGDELNKN